MRFSAAILFSVLMVATPVFSAPAPAPEPAPEPFHISPKVKAFAKKAGHVAAEGLGIAAPYLIDAIVKREEGMPTYFERDFDESELFEREFDVESSDLFERDFEYESGELLEREFDDEESYLARREELDQMADLFERDFTDGELEYLERRMSQKAKNFFHGAGHVLKEAWETVGPTAMETVAAHYKVI